MHPPVRSGHLGDILQCPPAGHPFRPTGQWIRFTGWHFRLGGLDFRLSVWLVRFDGGWLRRAMGGARA